MRRDTQADCDEAFIEFEPHTPESLQPQARPALAVQVVFRLIQFFLVAKVKLSQREHLGSWASCAVLFAAAASGCGRIRR